MKKYQTIMTGICSLVLVFGLVLSACDSDGGDGGGFGGALEEAVGRGGEAAAAPTLAPTGVTVSARTSGTITLTWSKVESATNYRVSRADSADGPYSVRKEEIKGTSYTDTGLSPNTFYYYKVGAYNGKGYGPDSSIVPGNTTAGGGNGVQPPVAPTGVTATRISEDEVSVTWNPVDGALLYFVYWAFEDKEEEYEREESIEAPPYISVDWTKYNHGYFKVSAFNAAGEGPKSATASFGTYSGEGSSGSPPSTPSNISTSASSSTSITLSWSSVQGASGYNIYRKMQDDDIESFLRTTSSTFYTDEGLYQGTTYYYRISAYNAYGESPKSTAVSAKTQEAIPSAPQSVYASASSSSSITVYWSEVPGATSYKIYRSSADIYYSFHKEVTVSSSSSALSYSDTGLSPGSTYYYKVSAVNSAGESTQSSKGSATTWSSSGNSGSALSPPGTIWAYRSSSDKVYVSWNSVSGAVKYVIYWSRNANGPYNYDGEVTAPQTYFYSEDWSGTGTAYFKVAVVNAAGVESEKSTYESVDLSGYYSIGTVPSQKRAIQKIP
ncbi:MAG: fibronectin type III domain-containing protein [Treponema sp.]|nr:fibronectin type III domain-containing protein [Treponema sp.]